MNNTDSDADRTAAGTDPQLSALLRQWPAPAVPGNLGDNVWRRIRLLEAPARPGLGGWLAQALWHPAWSLGLAAVLGTAIGIGSGLFSAPPVTPTAQATEFLAPGTLAGTYVQLTTGGTR